MSSRDPKNPIDGTSTPGQNGIVCSSAHPSSTRLRNWTLNRRCRESSKPSDFSNDEYFTGLRERTVWNAWVPSLQNTTTLASHSHRSPKENTPNHGNLLYLAPSQAGFGQLVWCLVADCRIGIVDHLLYSIWPVISWRTNQKKVPGHTLNKSRVLLHIYAPIPDITMHLHCWHQKVLIYIQVDCILRAEVSIAIYDVTSRFSLSADPATG